jgi:hypothetical protein
MRMAHHERRGRDVTINAGLIPKRKGFSYYCRHVNYAFRLQNDQLPLGGDLQNREDRQLQTVRDSIVTRTSRKLKKQFCICLVACCPLTDQRRALKRWLSIFINLRTFQRCFWEEVDGYIGRQNQA